MYSESPTRLERPSQRLSLDSFHDAEGLPIPSPFDSTRPERPKIVTGDEDEDALRHSSTFASPDIDQKVSQHLLGEQSADMIHGDFPGYGFFSAPAIPPSFDAGDLSMSPAAMFLSSFTPTSAPPRTPDAEGETVSGYKLGPIIGQGGFSTIRRASSSSGGTVAVKIVRRSDIAKQTDSTIVRKRLDHEASIWLSLSHEHILPLFSTAHTSYADFFITLFCPAGSLFDILKRDGRPALPQDDAGMMFRQVVRGLRYLHEVALLVHRDIKLENVLVDEMGVCRIGDFGMTRNIGDLDADDEELELDSRQQNLQEEDHQRRWQAHGVERRATSISQPKRQTKLGLPAHLSMIRHRSGPRHRNSTPTGNDAKATHPSHAFQPGSLPYAAPELLMPQLSAQVRVEPAQDIWALGVMLYTLLSGRLPFVDSFEPRLQMKILHGTYEVPTDIGRGAELVIQGCINKSTSDRWSIAMVDEVAWGVGWGAEESVASESHEVEIQNIRDARRSRSRPRVSSGSGSVSTGSGSGSTPSLDAARRRSTSRARRSLSRVSVLSDRSTSTRNTSRSTSRHSPQNYSALADSMISTTSSNSSVPFDPHFESALLTSPGPSRGRRTTKAHVRSASRSPSPSVVPMTPLDFIGGRPLPLLDEEPDLPRGRKAFAGEIPTPRAIESYSREELDSVDENIGWSAGPKKGGLLSQLSHRLNPLSYIHNGNSSASSLWGSDEIRGRDRGNIIRAESTPPAAEDPFLRKDSSSSLGVPVSNARSRSAGCDGVRR